MASGIEKALAKLGPARLHDRLSPQQRQALRYCWPLWARPVTRRSNGTYTGQLPPPGLWHCWLFLAGRSAGKSRCASEWVREKAENNPGCRIALIGPTEKEARDSMVFGESGLMSVCPPWNKPHWNTISKQLEWRNGSLAQLFTAEAPDSTRGFHFHWAWADEIASWRRLTDAWSNLLLALRLGTNPCLIATTTPRPLQFLRDLRARASTVVTTATTFENTANPKAFLEEMRAQYGESALGRQELEGVLREEEEGALWRREWIEKNRVQTAPHLTRVVVGVDPSASDKEKHDECGVVVVGIDEKGHGYVLGDYSAEVSPEVWAARVVEAYHAHGANYVCEETQRGGALATTVVRLVDSSVPIRNRAAVGAKRARAEPVALLSQQGRLHVVGSLPELEDECCSWDPLKSPKSPNRIDALTIAACELLVKAGAPSLGRPPTERRERRPPEREFIRSGSRDFAPGSARSGKWF
jgi:phage terminase large subunit-like protein